jgi:outer membrane protein assembly factor BamB
LDNEIKWEKDFSYPVSANAPGKPKEVKVPFGPGGNDDSIFITLSSGQLVALDAANGQVRWIADITGSTICYGKHLYHLNGPELIELDVKTGIVTKTLEFGKYIDRKGLLMSSPFKVYEDLILIRGMDSIVALVDRRTLTLTDWIQLDSKEPPRIASNDTVMHWCNDHLYVVDMSENLHIYSR